MSTLFEGGPTLVLEPHLASDSWSLCLFWGDMVTCIVGSSQGCSTAVAALEEAIRVGYETTKANE